MTDLAKKRFAQLGQQLQYDQLGTVRRQAEGWRNGLTGLTGLVGVVFVLKGRESVAGMPEAWRWTTALLLVLAFVLLLAGALGAVRAAHGQLGEQTWLSGDRLLTAVLDEVERTQDALVRARRLAVAGLCAIVAAIAVSWLAPVADPASDSGKGGPYVVVDTDSGVRCGEWAVSDSRAVTIKPAKGKAWIRIPMGKVRSVTPTDAC
ncbi:hypothetical protein OG562_08500 [Streptomyces sp. NBC_01275]|uniref:hypothetical protein n=1 Tax=Streptomyces sp. NBC_01275 TaxID=2903807 RepID=UPI0022507816|nr:hypothetical protein [Streptomyces sp. NBC_01275]MCX4761006.1 hypothetical protein [Streptomyces sp. NBC_01275]